MDLERARENFSAYFEGTLDKGLRGRLERAIQEDANIAAEYRSFERTMESLGLLGKVEVPTPDDLFERISARLDHSVWQSKQTQKAGWFDAWWKSALVGVGALSVLGLAILQSNHWTAPAKTINASMVSIAAPSHLDITPSEQGVLVNMPAGNSHRVTFYDANDKELAKVLVDSTNAIKNKPLSSADGQTQLVSIQVDDNPPMWIALPGKSQIAAAESGSVKEFAYTVASEYGIPVVVSALDPTVTVTWKLDKANLIESVQPTAKQVQLSCELRQANGRSILWLTQN